MKKLAAIGLICLLVFNWYGYRLYITYLNSVVKSQLQAQLEKDNYRSDDLIEIHIPLNLPYVTDWKDFEPFYGETVINGQHFNYVKRKLSNGELVLLCIPNENKNKLQKAGIEIFKQVNDLQQTTGKKSGTKDQYSKAFSPDYTMVTTDWKANSITLVFSTTSLYLKNLQFQSKTPPAQPPEC